MQRFIVVTMLVWGLIGRADAACVGDCNANGEVTVDELIQGVNIALGNAAASQCVPFDASGDGDVTINEIIAGVNNLLAGCTGSVEGDYSGDLTLGARHASIELSADASGHLTGSLVVESTSLAARLWTAVTFPVGGFSATLDGSVNPATGAFEVNGSFNDGVQTIPIHITGTLPGSTGTVAISAQIGDQTFNGTLSAGAPTPTPTPSGPTPTPVASCGDGSLSVSFSNVSADTNANTAALGLGKSSASDVFDGSSNSYIWVVVGAVCQPVANQPLRGIALQGIGVGTAIQPGTYTIASGTPPFIGITYTENNVTTNPANNFIHNWSSTGGTLVITDAGGGKLNVHAFGVTMVKGLVFQGAVGTFTLDISGTINKVTHG